MANLSTNERVEIILLCGREGWSLQNVADEFSRLHPDREPINKSSVGRLLSKFKEFGSILDKKKPGRNEDGISQQNWGVTPSIITVDTCNVKLRKVRIISYFHT